MKKGMIRVNPIEWFKNLFSNQEKRNKKWTESNHHNEDTPSYDKNFHPSYVEVIHVNPNVYLAHRGARVCVGKLPIEGSVVDRMNHISKIIGMGHESILEHTNTVVLFKFPNFFINNHPVHFAEMMSCMKYCNVVVRHFWTRDDTKKANVVQGNTYLLIGASVRGWMHLLREIRREYRNSFIPFIEHTIYSTCEKCFLGPLIKYHLLVADQCTYLPDGSVTLVDAPITQIRDSQESKDSVGNMDAECEYINDPVEQLSDHADLVYASPVNTIYEKVREYGFTMKDVYRVTTLSFVFHDISRTCSHQLVRHRNGISQESQRYVGHDYNKKTDFIDPMVLNLQERYAGEEYKPVLEHMKRINPFKEYLYLISNKVEKEDARAWLPSNVTTKLMMTFTYENFAKFLKLRMAKGAQKEIRELAEEAAYMVLLPEEVEDFIEYACTWNSQLKDDENPFEGFSNQDLQVDDILAEERMKPTSMKIETTEDAKKILDMQERYCSGTIEV